MLQFKNVSPDADKKVDGLPGTRGRVHPLPAGQGEAQPPPQMLVTSCPEPDPRPACRNSRASVARRRRSIGAHAALLAGAAPLGPAFSAGVAAAPAWRPQQAEQPPDWARISDPIRPSGHAGFSPARWWTHSPRA